MKRFKELGNASDCLQSGRPRTSLTQKLKNAVKARATRNPKRSMMKTSRELDVNEPTLRRIVKTELKLSPLKVHTSKHLTDLQKEKKRLTRVKMLLNKLKEGTETAEDFFTDVKLFTVQAICNRQNDRILATSTGDVPDSVRWVFRRQKPSSVVVWAAISKTWKSPLIFVPQFLH